MDGTNRTETSKYAESKLVRYAEENALMAEIGRIVNSSLVSNEVFDQLGRIIELRASITISNISEVSDKWPTELLGRHLMQSLIP